ncbi:hypothetical protein OCC_07918 [Thermococcus litoralis DSM 5473]|uniref:Uncharacterized protein n=1 Tax=Thermococcus litoralis (strain ATCC 51850 / DSM 5473 / JCM 8560 / NS-C) TaxID=523849 RepID=H3ZKX6_THELN|nr:hypothetical protein [Thermococcus litoralis]EHR79377.1 hypothetical protein OCC_07918 [Thermococcus litoralis DSM 5473]
MEPKAFLEFSKELRNLCQNPNSGFSKSFQTRQDYPEIVYRTMANRSYYYLYHEVKPILINLIKSDFDILQELDKIGITPEGIDEIFSHHSKIIRFFEDLERLFKKYNLKNLKYEAQQVAKTLKSYKTLRELADYYINITEGEVDTSIGSLQINFNKPSQAVIDYLTEDVEKAKEDIIEVIKDIFEKIKHITDFYYVQEIRDIVEKLSKRPWFLTKFP